MFLSQLIQNFDCMRQWTLLRCFHWLNLQSKSLPHFGQSLGGNQPDCCFCGKIHDIKSKIKKHIRKYHSSVDRGKLTRAWWKRYLRSLLMISRMHWRVSAIFVKKLLYLLTWSMDWMFTFKSNTVGLVFPAAPFVENLPRPVSVRACTRVQL